jgi:hypothetical protein
MVLVTFFCQSHPALYGASLAAQVILHCFVLATPAAHFILHCIVHLHFSLFCRSDPALYCASLAAQVILHRFVPVTLCCPSHPALFLCRSPFAAQVILLCIVQVTRSRAFPAKVVLYSSC